MHPYLWIEALRALDILRPSSAIILTPNPCGTIPNWALEGFVWPIFWKIPEEP